MAFKDYLIEEAKRQVTLPLLEAVNGYFAKAAAALSSRGEDDSSNAGVDFKRLIDLIVGMRIIGSKDLRSGITKDDVGLDPSDVQDMYNAMTKVPDSLKASMPSDISKFFKELAGLAPKLKKEEQEDLQNLLSNDPKVRKQAEQKLKAMALKVDSMYNKLKTLASK